MPNEIPDYDDGPREEMVPVFGASGVEMVPASQLEAWLSSDESIGKRPPGSGPDGRWTLEDEKAAFKIVEENQDFGGRNPYDVLADKLASPEVGYFSEGLKEESARQKLSKKYPDATGINFDERGGSMVRFGPDSAVPFIYTAPTPTPYAQSQNRTIDAARKAFRPSKTVPMYPYDEVESAIEKQFVDAARQYEPEEQFKYVGDQVTSKTPGYGGLDELREGVRSALELQKRENEAKRRGLQDPAFTLGPSFKVD